MSKRLLNITIQERKKALIMFDDMIPDMISYRRLLAVIIELFNTGWKLNISSVFIAQSYLPVPKDVIINTIHLSIIKISNSRELQQIVVNCHLRLTLMNLRGLPLFHQIIHDVCVKISWN